MSHNDGTLPAGAPTPDWHYPRQQCPHCDQAPTANRMDEHIAATHADLPDCTARIEPETGGLYTCAFKAVHKDGEYGDWHASIWGAPTGRYVWADWAQGAVPHRSEEEPDA